MNKDIECGHPECEVIDCMCGDAIMPEKITRGSKTFIPDVERVIIEKSIMESLSYPNLFSPEECAEICSLLTTEYPQIPLEPEEDTIWIFERLLAVLTSANEATYQFEIDHFDLVHVDRFSADNPHDDKYEPHISIGSGPSGNRKLTMVVQLTEDKDYIGGTFSLPQNDFDADREIGSVTVFPSFIRHCVDPVVLGTRFSLTAYAGGRHRFR